MTQQIKQALMYYFRGFFNKTFKKSHYPLPECDFRQMYVTLPELKVYWGMWLIKAQIGVKF
ncbi:hypothetical protein GCM10011328_27640 [Hafnia psychrotolerans]|uniref:Uncharacterized protein n=1 Tax=Hafnia psychrotolerans TaxID=1477018 RepID=A0ABQ1GUL4_9GAMM|nr:hypothetical protein GCM10011328_27640 [Hafnia psychrotolerans]